MRTIKLSNVHGHRRACVPCALSALIGKSYEDINAWLLYRGYRSSNNRSTKTSMMQMAEFGLIRIRDFDTLTINQFLEKNPVGDFFVLVSGHALTVMNAIAYDTIDSTKRKIKSAYIRTSDDLPVDFYKVSHYRQLNEEHALKKESNIKREREREKKSIAKKRIDKERRNELKKSDGFKVSRLVGLKEKWQSKLLRCQKALSKINKKLKYYERKKNVVN